MSTNKIQLLFFATKQSTWSLFFLSFLLFILSSCSHSAPSPANIKSETSSLADEKMIPLEGRELFLQNLKELHQQQFQLDDYFQEIFLDLKKMSSYHSTSGQNSGLPPEEIQKYHQNLKNLAISLINFSKKIESTHSIGQSYFDYLEEKAKELSDMDQQSDRFREIIKFRRKFRLFYLNLKQLNSQSMDLFKNLRHQGSEIIPDARTPELISTSGSMAKELKVSLMKTERKLKEFQTETQNSKTQGEAFIQQFIQKGPKS